MEISVKVQIKTSEQQVCSSVTFVGFNRYLAFGHFARLGKATVHKKKFSIKDFFSKSDQIRRKLRIWSHLPRKSLMENFIFCAVLSEITSSMLLNFSYKNVRIFGSNISALGKQPHHEVIVLQSFDL